MFSGVENATAHKERRPSLMLVQPHLNFLNHPQLFAFDIIDVS